MFKVESATVSTTQRIQIRKLLQQVGLAVKQGEELAYVPQCLQKMMELADRAGGEAPKPSRPDTSSLEEIRLTSGNEQLLALYNRREELAQFVDAWSNQAGRIAKRWPAWLTLRRLAGHANGIQDAEVLLIQVKAIEQQRQLLEEPDLIAPLTANLTQLLRDELNRLDKEYQKHHEQGMKRLQGDSNWQQLEPEQRNSLLADHKLTLADQPAIKLASTEEVLKTLDGVAIAGLTDRVAAMPARFDAVARAAAELLEPQAQFIQVPRRTLKTDAEIDAWVDEVKQQLKTALQQGPVVIR